MSIRLNRRQRDVVYGLATSEVENIGDELQHAGRSHELTPVRRHAARLAVIHSLLDDIGWARQDVRPEFEITVDHAEMFALVAGWRDAIDASMRDEGGGSPPARCPPLLNALPGGAQNIDPGAATRDAWECVMDGVAAALQVDGLPAPERARLLRCHRNCSIKAGRSPLSLAQSQRLDRAPSALNDDLDARFILEWLLGEVTR